MIFSGFSFYLLLALFYLAPFVLLYVLFQFWMRYIQAYYIFNLEWMTLEIKIPREIAKNPRAMEIVLSGLHQTGEGSLIDKYIKGKVRAWFSLEMVSIGGNVHFFVHAEKKFKNLIEAQFYSQYSEVEIYEVEDYTKGIDYVAGDKLELWGVEFKLNKEDAYPIKTYIDYGLDKDPKEEMKVDPMTPMLEAMGGIRPNEQVWLQIIIMAARKKFPKPGTWFTKQEWQDAGRDVMKKMVDAKKSKEAEGAFFSEFSLTESERNVIKAIDRSVDKLGFECGFRILYMAPEEIFDKGVSAAMMASVKQFNSQNLNGFTRDFDSSFDYPWQDPTGRRLLRLKAHFFDAYCNRGYFFPPFSKKRKPFILNTEELATVYHLPGSVAETPTLSRIESRRGEPPGNLPV